MRRNVAKMKKSNRAIVIAREWLNQEMTVRNEWQILRNLQIHGKRLCLYPRLIQHRYEHPELRKSANLR